jgi:type III secretory pathway component EscS
MTVNNERELINGVVGTLAPILGTITSLQEQLEWGMRILSLSIGIIVGVLSLIKFMKNR